MQPPSQRISACPTCGAPLEETVGGGGGCMFCLLQAGIGSEEEETVHDSNPEQIAHSALDVWSDIYSLGETLSNFARRERAKIL